MKNGNESWDVLTRNQTSELRILHCDMLPLSHRDSRVSEVYYKVHMTHILHTARISNFNSIMFVIGEVVSFELCREIKKDGFRLDVSMGQRKNSESPWGMELLTFRFCTLMLCHWATDTLQWVRSITKFMWHASCLLLGSAILRT